MGRLVQLTSTGKPITAQIRKYRSTVYDLARSQIDPARRKQLRIGKSFSPDEDDGEWDGSSSSSELNSVICQLS